MVKIENSLNSKYKKNPINLKVLELKCQNISGFSEWLYQPHVHVSDQDKRL